MLKMLNRKPPIDRVAQPTSLRPPRWAQDLAARGSAATLVTAVIPGFRQSDPQTLEQRVVDAYEQVRHAVASSPHPHVVRIWNHIPGIHDRIDRLQDRYRLFNAGRFAAMRRWFGSTDEIRRRVPAASGVGHDGDDLVVYALAMKAPGFAVENPDQVPAYHYSPRYGPVPPCFARATRVESSPCPALLISGTAAITGEDSRFGADLAGQFRLTLQNLSKLIAKAYTDISRDPPAAASILGTLEHVRIYLPTGVDEQTVERLARDAFARSTSLERVRADLCRCDLLVEIEGLARMS